MCLEVRELEIFSDIRMSILAVNINLYLHIVYSLALTQIFKFWIYSARMGICV